MKPIKILSLLLILWVSTVGSLAQEFTLTTTVTNNSLFKID